MATSKLLLRHLRRSCRRISSLPAVSLSHSHIVTPDFPVSPPVLNRSWHCPSPFSLPRSFSSIPDEPVEFDLFGPSEDLDAAEPLGLDEISDGVTGEILEEALPVRAVIYLLDGFHDLTGLPWWIVIASSTLAIRVALLPLLVVQLQKLIRIAEVFPKLPPPFPPPFSGKGFIDQFSLFNKERRALGCPSYLWFIATFSVQVPCFFLFMTTIRSMSLGGHPGFDCGGALWFQDLTAMPHGAFSPVFPFLIASLHYTNIQISFKAISTKQDRGLFGLLAKWYKRYLDILTVPFFAVAFFLPQGSLLYWVTNSSLSLILQSSLKHPAVLAKLGLLVKDTTIVENSAEINVAEVQSVHPNIESKTISPHNLTPKELIALSVQYLSKDHHDRAIHLLHVALEKDPGYIRGLLLMGQTLLQKEQLEKAIEYLERAITMLLDGRPLEVEDVDLLILASQWAGIAYVRQEKMAEGITHLKRIAAIEEPEDPKSKAHYFDGFLLLSSALHKEGDKAEAAKYLRSVVAYDPTYSYLLEQCEADDDDFTNDLASSRRRINETPH